MSKGGGVDLDTVLSHLPATECQRYLFKRLDKKSLLAARSVNKLWQSLVDPMVDFHLELTDSSKKYVAAFGGDRKVKSISATSFQGRYPSERIYLEAEMLRITVNVLDGDESFQAFRQRRKSQKATKNIGLSQFNYRKLIQDFYFVDKLHIASLAVKTFSNPKILSKVYLPNVKEMIITFFDGGLHQLIPFMRNVFPTLKAVNIANVAECRKDRPMLYSWIYGFVARHFKTLEDVTLIFPEGVIDDDDEALTELGGQFRRDHKMPPALYQSAKSRLQKMKLDKFILDISNLEGRTGRYDMGLAILYSQTSLSELHLDNLHLKDLPLWRKLASVIEKLSGTLVSLSLGGCFCGPTIAIGIHKFSCTWVKNCKKLESLEMVVCGLVIDSIEDLPNSIKTLNLGHMLNQQQIEYICLNLINLETWIIPQRGCLVNIFIPKVTLYLFEAILHLPKLTKIHMYAECSEKDKIMEFVATESGITKCGHSCLMDDERSGNLVFHICRDKFFREHSNLKNWMENNRKDYVQQLGHQELLEYFIHNVLDGRLINLDMIPVGVEEDRDIEEEDLLHIFDFVF